MSDICQRRHDLHIKFKMVLKSDDHEIGFFFLFQKKGIKLNMGDSFLFRVVSYI